MQTMANIKLTQHINGRILLFAAAVALLLGFPMFMLLRAAWNRGIEDHGTYQKVDLKALGNFDFDGNQGTLADIPPHFRKLDGQRVLLRGEMYNPLALRGINDFQLVYSIQKCCFGGPPRVQERVFARLPSGRTTSISDSLVDVMGTLHVNPLREGDAIVSVYTLDVESIQAVR